MSQRLRDVLRELPRPARVDTGNLASLLSKPSHNVVSDRKASELAAEYAYQAGLEEGRREGLASRDQAMVEAEQHVIRRIEQERIAWTRSLASNLETRIGSSLQDAEERLCGAVVRILAPLVRTSLQARALEQLTAAVHAALPVASEATIVVRGPQPLAAEVAEHLTGRGCRCRVVADASCLDVEIDLGEGVVSTGLADLVQRLERLGE